MQDPTMIGNDLPSQGGITGQMNRNILPPVYPGFDAPMNPMPDMSMGADVYGGVVPPPDFNQMRMQQLFSPEHAAQDRINQLLGQIPQPENPSFMRKLSASLVAGGGNFDQADKILHEPYDRKYEEWKNQFGPALQSANLERYSNATERQAAQNQMQFDTQNRRISETEAHNRETEKLGQDKLEIQRKRAEAYDFKVRNPAWKMVPSKGGNVFFVSPDGTQKIDTSIPTGSMTDYDRINLMGENRLEQIGAQGNEARKTEEVRQGNRLELEDVRQPNRIELKATPSGNSINSPNRPTSEYQIKQGRINRAVFYRNEHPELADSIRTENGEVTIDPPNSGIFGLGGNGMTASQYKEAQDYIFGPQMGRSNNVTQQNLQPGQSIPPDGFMIMTNPQGQKVKVPAKKIQWAKENGYK
jgi:hypothetical protein